MKWCCMPWRLSLHVCRSTSKRRTCFPSSMSTAASSCSAAGREAQSGRPERAATRGGARRMSSSRSSIKAWPSSLPRVRKRVVTSSSSVVAASVVGASAVVSAVVGGFLASAGVVGGSCGRGKRPSAAPSSPAARQSDPAVARISCDTTTKNSAVGPEPVPGSS